MENLFSPSVCAYVCSGYNLWIYMWQSHVEIEDCSVVTYSVVYFDHIAAFQALYH